MDWMEFYLLNKKLLHIKNLRNLSLKPPPWIISLQKVDNEFPAYAISAGLYIIIVGLLLAQPDVGMAIVISAIWGIQVFIYGLPLFWVICIGLLFLGGGFGSSFWG